MCDFCGKTGNDVRVIDIKPKGGGTSQVLLCKQCRRFVTMIEGART